MRIVLSTWQKFHFFHLARQFERRGMLEQIFTTYPMWKLRNEGIPRSKIIDYSFLETLELGKNRFGFSWETLDWKIRLAKLHGYDKYILKKIHPCDVYIGLSGSGLAGGTLTQSRGGKYICERSSSHIEFAENILAEEFAICGEAYDRAPQKIFDRECEEYSKSDIVVVPSTFAKRTFLECGFADSKIVVNPLGAELSQFYPVDDRNDDEFVVSFVGSIQIRKGVRYLLDAFARLKHPKKRLVIVGVMFDEMKEEIRRHSTEHVKFVGKADKAKLRQIFSQSNAMVLPSVEDGFGLVIAEAMACGCPVIATENTGGPDIINDDIEGYIVPIRDGRVIAERLQELADNPSKNKSMSLASIERVKSMGGWGSYGATYERLMRDLISNC